MQREHHGEVAVCGDHGVAIVSGTAEDDGVGGAEQSQIDDMDRAVTSLAQRVDEGRGEVWRRGGTSRRPGERYLAFLGDRGLNPVGPSGLAGDAVPILW